MPQQKFVKNKPANEVDAIQFNTGNANEVINFSGVPEPPEYNPEEDVNLTLALAPVTLKPGDWLIKGPGGELSRCSAEDFNTTYHTDRPA